MRSQTGQLDRLKHRIRASRASVYHRRVAVKTTTGPGLRTATRVELGCGAHKRDGFFGIDIAPGPDVDLVLDIEREPLPFADDTVEHVYSSHTFEHLVADGSPKQTLREVVRVMRHGGLVEIWTPYGRSNDALLFGHAVFYTETHWKHICYMYDDFYLGEGVLGRFNWKRTEYVLHPGILEQVDAMRIPVSFALEHLDNVALEFGVFLEVDKSRTRALSPQYPDRDLCYVRGRVVRRLNADASLTPGDEMTLRRRLRRRVAASRAAPMLRRFRDAGFRIVGRAQQPRP